MTQESNSRNEQADIFGSVMVWMEREADAALADPEPSPDAREPDALERLSGIGLIASLTIADALARFGNVEGDRLVWRDAIGREVIGRGVGEVRDLLASAR